MSVIMLKKLYNECQKIITAGSVYAVNNEIINSYIPELKIMGEKAAVFKKIAEMAESLSTCSREELSEKILELSGLTGAVLYTQLDINSISEKTETTNFDGVITENISWKNLSNNSFYEKIRTNSKYSLSQSESLNIYNIRAIHRAIADIDNFADIPFQQYFFEMVKRYGVNILPIIGYNGIKSDNSIKEYITKKMENEKNEKMKAILILIAGKIKGSEPIITKNTTGGRLQRKACMNSLVFLDCKEAAEILEKNINGKDYDIAIDSLAASENVIYKEKLMELANKFMDYFIKEENIKETDIKRVVKIIENLHLLDDEKCVDFLIEKLGNEKVFKYTEHGALADAETFLHTKTIAKIIADELEIMVNINSEKILKVLKKLIDNGERYISNSVFASMFIDEPGIVYNQFSKKGEDIGLAELVFRGMFNAFERDNVNKIKIDKRWIRILVNHLKYEILDFIIEQHKNEILKELKEKLIRILMGEQTNRSYYITKENCIRPIVILDKYNIKYEDELYKVISEYKCEFGYENRWILEGLSDNLKKRIVDFANEPVKESFINSLIGLSKEKMNEYKNTLKSIVIV